jgi:phosphoribosylformylglycinamidine synthase
MTSESQERMLAIVTPESLERVMDVCRRWEVSASVVGKVTSTGRLRILDGWDGEVLADVPAASLHEDAPCYDRPIARPADLESRRSDDPARLPPPADCGDDLLELVGATGDRSWVYRQYDHQLFLNTVVPPGGDAALLRLSGPGVPSPSDWRRGIALSTDGNSRWCAIDPRSGTALVVAESALNVACTGAVPVAVVNCLNFGNPEHPEVMWQLSEAIDGMSEACRGLSLPVIGGNVSLYNESRGRDIDPTPVVGTLGLVERLERPPAGARLQPGGKIVLVGGSAVSLSGSRWAVHLRGHRGGTLPALDLDLHQRLIQLVCEVVSDTVSGQGGSPLTIHGVHDVSDGGLGVALTEMAVRGRVGFRVGHIGGHAELFGEGPSRVVFCVEPAGVSLLVDKAQEAGLAATVLGDAVGERLVVEGLLDVSLEDAAARWRGDLPSALAGGPVLEPVT